MNSRKAIVIALFISLVLNGVLVGLFVGHRLMGEERHAMHGMAKQLLRDEPKELAEPMRHVLELHRKDMVKAYRSLRSARREMVSILKQPVATEEEINSGFAAIRVADDNLKQVSHEVLSVILATLPPEQRLDFAMRELGRMQKRPPPRQDDTQRVGEGPPR
jgi:uncharacterized membrane protein